ncbi:MAG: sulfatase [Armatimonadetes bacterium]|nr:sulfatase [Armatimonadota bacterium]
MRILFLDLDTLRPDHLGCYGYHRQTSPTLDAVAARGVRFDNYYCSDAPCLPSRAALVTGRHGIRSGIVGHGGTAADLRLQGRDRGFRNDAEQLSLWGFLRQQGYHTASVSPFAQRHSAFWFNAGFAETYDTGSGGMESAEEVTPHVLDWLGRHASEDNWFLHVNYWDPHTPYRAPAEFGNPFADEPLPSWMTPDLLAEHRTQPGLHGCWEVSMADDVVSPRYPRHPGQVPDMAGFRQMIDGYDCGIRYMDGHLDRLLNTLADTGVLDDTAIIVTSDHGENLGELGSYGEHGTSDYVTHRIPMLIAYPGLAAGTVDSALHYNLDLGPTLAELFGAQPRAGWQGQSYAGALTGESYAQRDHLVLGQCCHGAQRSVRFGPWHYIRTYHDFYHLWPREMLFDVANDPHETHDLAAQRPEVCAEAARLLLNWHDDQMMAMPDAVDPLWTVMREGGPLHSRGLLPAYCQRLEATGRGQHVEELRRRHPGEFR